jgi:putative membrane protein
MGLVLVITGLIIFIILSILISLIRTILKYFSFHAWLQGDIIGLSSGLLRKIEYRIPVAKVQYLVWAGNPLRHLLGFKSILIKQAAAEESGGRSQQKIEIPSCREEQSGALEEVVFGRQIAPGSNRVRAHAIPYMLISFYAGTALASVLITVAWLTGRVFFWPALLLIPALVFWSYKYAMSVLIDIQEDVVVIHKGWLFPRRFVLPVYKAQSVSFVQSVFSKRRRLATFEFYTASGWVSARFLPQQTVKQLCNFVLYKTESYKGSWM